MNVWGRRRIDIGTFGRVEPRGGGWDVLGECGREGRFCRYVRVGKVYFYSCPRGDVVERTFGFGNSLFFNGKLFRDETQEMSGGRVRLGVLSVTFFSDSLGYGAVVAIIFRSVASNPPLGVVMEE